MEAYWLIHESEVGPNGEVSITYPVGQYSHKALATSKSELVKFYNSNEGRSLRRHGQWYTFKIKIPPETEIQDGWAIVPLPIFISGKPKMEKFLPSKKSNETSLLMKLSEWLKSNSLVKEAQQVQDLSQYEEPWHEDVVKEFGEEPISEDEYLGKIHPFDISTDPDIMSEIFTSGIKTTPTFLSKVMEKESFKPVESGEKSAYVGAGAQGSVFRGVYQGKPAVAKILEEVKGESRNWNDIMTAKRTMPPELQKHIPEVYLAKVGSLGPRQQYEIIIMEELNPLPESMKQVILKYREITEKKINSLLKDEEYLYKIAEAIKEGLLGKVKDSAWILEEFPEVAQISVKEIFDFILSLGMLVHNSENHLARELANYITKKYGMNETDEYDLRQVIYHSISNAFYVPHLPRSFNIFKEFLSPYWESIPETGSLLEMLKKLSEFGIQWSDLHMNNIMVDNDGNLKIIDVGLYQNINPVMSVSKKPSELK